MNDQIVFPVATCTHRESHLRCTLGAGKATGTCSIRNAIDDKPTRPLRYIASLQFSSVTYPKSSPFIGLKRRYRVQSISLGHGGKSSFTKDNLGNDSRHATTTACVTICSLKNAHLARAILAPRPAFRGGLTFRVNLSIFSLVVVTNFEVKYKQYIFLRFSFNCLYMYHIC